MSYLVKWDAYAKEKKLSAEFGDMLRVWYSSSLEAVKVNGHDPKKYAILLDQMVDLVIEQMEHPYQFEHFHKRVTAPVDLYRLGIELIRPLVVFEQSEALNLEYADKMQEQIAKGENVVLLSNHQTETDPQAIHLLLEKTHPKLAEEMIFVAGHRVVSDPMAVPFSKGCNLLCVYSKRYIEDNPDLKQERLLHNQNTIKRMGELLSEGGCCIYVAPSGGRDRPNRHGYVDVAAFDARSIEFFWLTAQNAKRPTHFYPLALSTYALLPPPNHVKKTLGEARIAKASPIFLAFGPELDMEDYPGHENPDKRTRRKLRAQYIWEQVRKYYRLITT
jgi:glycerol-3-phosphate O-acyltransferase